MSGVPLIGWAKPTPVDSRRFRPSVNRRTGFALVSAAGPLSNLILAVISAAILAFGGTAVRSNHGVVQLLGTMLQMNVGLCIFHLLPLATLDGSRLTPRSLDSFQQRIAPYSMFILMGILMVRPLAELLIYTPVRFVTGLIVGLFGLQG